MKPAYAVLHLATSAFSPETGLLFGSNKLIIGSGYTTYYFTTLDGAIKRAEEIAKVGAVGCIFKLLEAHIVKPAPVQVITINRS